MGKYQDINKISGEKVKELIRSKSNVVFTIALILFVLLPLITACGGPDDTPVAAEPDDTTESPSSQNEEQPSESTETSGNCPAATNISIESTNGAYTEREPLSWDILGSQEAHVSRSYGTASINIYIANFNTSESLKDFKPEDGQAILSFALRIRGDSEAVPLETGVYDLLSYDDNDLFVTPKIILSGGSAVQISTNNINSAEFEITDITELEICGKFMIDEKWTRMNGEFRVPFAN